MFLALVIGSTFVAVPRGGAEELVTECLLDEQGRQLVPGGYVVMETVPYTPSDYQRMVRMGANFQVVRVPLGRIGGWKGQPPDPSCLQQFDALVRMGKDAGLMTIFKLVVYGIRPFGDEQWNRIWHDTDGTQDTLVAAWSRIWTRYKDEPSVFGYDLLNEPQRGLDRDYDRCQRERLLPLLRRLTDAMHAVSPEKWALYQPLLRKREDQSTPGRNPVVQIQEPFGRQRIIYAPHLYQMDPSVIGPMLDDFQRQAILSRAPLLLGEWGSPTRATTDVDLAEQARYTKVYQLTVNELEARGIGGIKAWFCGARKPISVPGSTNWMTWSIFSDESPAGLVERKYITDVIVRPRPLVVAGRLKRFGNDFAEHRFEMTLAPDASLGGTEIFVPEDRHYPAGFRVEVGPGLTIAHDPVSHQLHTLEAATAGDRKQAELVRWDNNMQRLFIEKWVGRAPVLTVRILPMKPVHE